MSERAVPQAESPSQRLLELLAGKWITAAIGAAAELNLADALAGGPLSLAMLADATSCDPARLERLLRVLAGEGVVAQTGSGTYALTTTGEQLTSDKLRELARFVVDPSMWNPWSQLASAVKTGRSGFEATFGESLFAYLDKRPAARERYHVGVDAFTRREARALVDTFDFSSRAHVVDVGGGLGTLLIELAVAGVAPRLTLMDRPEVIAEAQSRFAALGLGARLGTLAGDFFSSPLPSADVFVIKHVLHNWDDEACVALLSRVREALSPGGHVLVIEGLTLPGGIKHMTHFMDLEMLVLCGEGRERSKPEFRSLFAKAGLQLETSNDLAGMSRLLVAQPPA